MDETSKMCAVKLGISNATVFGFLVVISGIRDPVLKGLKNLGDCGFFKWAGA